MFFSRQDIFGGGMDHAGDRFNGSHWGKMSLREKKTGKDDARFLV